MHKGSKGTDLHALLSASHETGVIPYCFGKITRRETATRQVKLEARRGRIQLRGGTLCRGPAAGLATEFAPTPWQGRLGRRRGNVQAGTRCGSLGLGLAKLSGDF